MKMPMYVTTVQSYSQSQTVLQLLYYHNWKILSQLKISLHKSFFFNSTDIEFNEQFKKSVKYK